MSLYDNVNPTEPSPAPEFFVEGFTCISGANGVAKMPFFSVMTTHHPEGRSEAEQRVVVRLAIPFGAMVGMHDALGRFLDQLRETGVLVEHVEH
jgi:hypothetical protein